VQWTDDYKWDDDESTSHCFRLDTELSTFSSYMDIYILFLPCWACRLSADILRSRRQLCQLGQIIHPTGALVFPQGSYHLPSQASSFLFPSVVHSSWFTYLPPIAGTNTPALCSSLITIMEAILQRMRCQRRWLGI
jgi:hypothetical protein